MLCSRAEDWIPEGGEIDARNQRSAFVAARSSKILMLTVNNHTPHPQLPNHLVQRSFPNEELLASVGESVERRSSDHEDVSLPHDGGFPVLSSEGIGSNEETESTDADSDTWNEKKKNETGQKRE